MALFIRKKKEQKAPANGENRIVLDARDDFPQRAANIWRALGFVSDRFGAINDIELILRRYAEVDAKLARIVADAEQHKTGEE